MNTPAKPSSHTSKNTVTIVLADDHTMMREGTRKLLEEDPALVVIGEARNGTEALALCHTLHPQVLILDIAMKGMNGFTVAQTLLTAHEQPTMILVLTAYGQTAYIQTMMRMGVKGYWLKSAGSNDIRRAVYDVAEGKISLDPEIRQLLVQQVPILPPLTTLTAREREVLKLIVQGLRNSDICERLHVSIKTVEAHLTSLYQKLGVQSRTEAVTYAREQGLLLDQA
ncbi:MAG: response regulator transcription factor [Ktedonobacteraceae bacterium]|nr:response regulator transcription factor [Ktedonobacteraceae bacterium]MBO0790044.1 response regulator transcription factor [Ktedonobacteraceae bacterium]